MNIRIYLLAVNPNSSSRCRFIDIHYMKCRIPRSYPNIYIFINHSILVGNTQRRSNIRTINGSIRKSCQHQGCQECSFCMGGKSELTPPIF